MNLTAFIINYFQNLFGLPSGTEDEIQHQISLLPATKADFIASLESEKIAELSAKITDLQAENNELKSGIAESERLIAAQAAKITELESMPAASPIAGETTPPARKTEEKPYGKSSIEQQARKIRTK